MKAPLLLLAAVLAGTAASGQEKVIPELAAPKAQYDAKIKHDVLDPFQKDVDNLTSKYRDELNRELTAAAKDSKGLEDAVAFNAELTLTEEDKYPPLR